LHAEALSGEISMDMLLRRFIVGDEGQDLIEYALLAGLISLASIAAIGALGDAISAGILDESTRVVNAAS
jgi:Flp pilus assembly pilin Flp